MYPALRTWVPMLALLSLMLLPRSAVSKGNRTATLNETVSTTIAITPTQLVTPSQNVTLTENATMSTSLLVTQNTVSPSPRIISRSASGSSTLTLTHATEDWSETRSFGDTRTVSGNTYSREQTETRTLSDSVSNDRKSSSSMTWANDTFTASSTWTLSNSSSRGSLSPTLSLSLTPSLSNSPSPSTTPSPSLEQSPTYIRTLTQVTPTPNTSTFSASPSFSRSPTNTTSGPTPPMSASNTTSPSPSLSVSGSNSTSLNESTSISTSESASISKPSVSPNVSPSKITMSMSPTTELTTSVLPPYTVPKAVFSTSAVVGQVFLARIQSFYTDPADIDGGAFTRDLFRALVAYTTNASAAAGTPSSPLYFLTDGAAAAGNVLIYSICQVDYVELDAGWSRMYNMSVCRNDDVGRSCTVTGSTSCKVAAVNYCNCSSQWQSYPPSKFVNLSAVANYPEPPPTPAPTPAPHATGGNGSSTSSRITAARRSRFATLDAGDSASLVVQLQFSFLLQNAPAFRPKTERDIIGNYTLLKNAVNAVLFGSYTDLHLAYFLLPGSGNFTNNTYFPTPPPVPIVRLTSSSSFLPVAALLIFAVIAAGIACHKLYKYVRWRMTVGKFRVAPRGDAARDDGGEGGLESKVDPNDVDDVEMSAKLGDGAWVRSGGNANSGLTSSALLAVPGATAQGPSSTFDPLADNANKALLGNSSTADKKLSDSQSDVSSEMSSLSQEGGSDEVGSNAVVRALHEHRHSSKHRHHHRGGKWDRKRLAQGIAASTRTLIAEQEEEAAGGEKERAAKEKKNASSMQALLGADIVIVGTVPRSKAPVAPVKPAAGGASSSPAPPTRAHERNIADAPAPVSSSNPIEKLNSTSKSPPPLPPPPAVATAPPVEEEDDEGAFSDAEGDEEAEEEEEGNYWDEEGEEEEHDEEEGGDDLR